MKKAIMHESELKLLKERVWRRRLTQAEKAQLDELLIADPLANGEWEKEVALSQALAEMPTVPVSSNFTARVIQAAQRAESKRLRRGYWLLRWIPSGLLPRAATAMVLLSAGIFTVYEYQSSKQAQTAQTLASVSRVANLPEIEWLQDFDTISQLSRVEVADTELLSVLQ